MWADLGLFLFALVSHLLGGFKDGMTFHTDGAQSVY